MVSPLAMQGSTLKDVNSAAINGFNTWSGMEKGVNWGCPSFG